MKILMVASEMTPFAKTGGLADVVGSLPKELKRRGHDVRVIIPFYKSVERGGFSIRKGRKSVEIEIGGTIQKGLLRQTTLNDIPVYLLEHKEYYSRDFLYGTPAGDYPDNAARYAFFCRGVLDLLKKMDFRPDILHCHDWQAALIPILLRYEFDRDPFYERTATIYTIHNLAYQGLFHADAMEEMRLDPANFTLDKLEFYGKVNLMKGGILTADVINTVSPTYREEIRTTRGGCGLEGVLQSRGEALFGILNGLDYSEWNPASDRELFKNYTPSALSGRVVNKLGLQKLLGLEQNADIPLLGMVSRLAAQKGLDLLEQLLPRLLEEELQLVLLGDGEEKYANIFSEIRQKGKKSFSFNTGFDPALAHKIYAGSDIFLMPSHYEPCGLGQLIALRYGAVPVVRKTGGLADTVFDVRDEPKEPNGFTFDAFSAEAFGDAVDRALLAFRNGVEWKKIMRRGMNSDFSWQRAAGKYEELYRLGLSWKGSDR